MNKKILAVILAAMLLFLAGCGAKANNVSNTNTAEPAVADFEKHGIAVNLKLGQEADYITACKTDKTQTTTGKLKITEKNIYKVGDKLPDPSLEALDEYEWIEIKAETVFGDDNAKDYGVDRASCVSNYYDLEYYELRVQAQDNGFTKFSVRDDKEDKAYNDCLYIKLIDNQGWNTDLQTVCNYTWYIRVPVGYDGMVIVFFNSALPWHDGQYIYEVLDDKALVFRVEG